MFCAMVQKKNCYINLCCLEDQDIYSILAAICHYIELCPSARMVNTYWQARQLSTNVFVKYGYCHFWYLTLQQADLLVDAIISYMSEYLDPHLQDVLESMFFCMYFEGAAK